MIEDFIYEVEIGSLNAQMRLASTTVARALFIQQHPAFQRIAMTANEKIGQQLLERARYLWNSPGEPEHLHHADIALCGYLFALYRVFRRLGSQFIDEILIDFKPSFFAFVKMAELLRVDSASTQSRVIQSQRTTQLPVRLVQKNRMLHVRLPQTVGGNTYGETLGRVVA